MTLGYFSHLNNSLSIASRGARQPETFPKTAIYCHLLPFAATKPLQPLESVAIEDRPASLGPGAQSGEWGEEWPRWNVAIDCRLSQDRRIDFKDIAAPDPSFSCCSRNDRRFHR